MVSALKSNRQTRHHSRHLLFLFLVFFSPQESPTFSSPAFEGILGVWNNAKRGVNGAQAAEIVPTRPAEVNALLAFRNAMTNASLLSDWSTSSDPCIPRRWTGLSCSFDVENGKKTQYFVSRIVLPNMGLQGTISPQIGSFASLKILDLSGNKLYGTLPEELSKLRLLKELRLGNNQLSGAIPYPIFTKLIKLQVLSMPRNNLTGPIYANVPALQKLREVDLSRNRLSGRIPRGMGVIPNLESLDLSHNLFTFHLPGPFWRLKSIKFLRLHRNLLTSKIPERWASLTSLKLLNLHGNFLNKTIPDFFGNFTDLRVLTLHENDFQGEIPPSIAGVRKLMKFSVYRNNLSGEVGPAFRRFGFKSFTDNEFLCVNISGTGCHAQTPADLVYPPEPPPKVDNVTEYLMGGGICTTGAKMDCTCAGGLQGKSECVDGVHGYGKCVCPDKGLPLYALLPLGLLGALALSAIATLLISSRARKALSSLSVPSLNFSSPTSGSVFGSGAMKEWFGKVKELYGKLKEKLGLGKSKSFVQLGNYGTTGYDGTDSDLYVSQGYGQQTLSQLDDTKRVPVTSTPSTSLAFSSSSSSSTFSPSSFFPFSLTKSAPPSSSAPTKQSVNLNPASLDSVRMFSLDELAKATNGLSPENVIMTDGKLRSFSGVLPDGQYVFVRELDLPSDLREEDFKGGVDKLTRVSSPYLMPVLGGGVGVAKTLGFKVAGGEGRKHFYLVYKAAQNANSLDVHLFDYASHDLRPLDWKIRFRTALQVARALMHLHSFYPQMVHGNLLADNVLLIFDPPSSSSQLCDYCLSTALDDQSKARDKTAANSMDVAAAVVAPELAWSPLPSAKSDVYSLGVLLLQLLTGRRPSDAKLPPNEQSLVRWAKPRLLQESKFLPITDANIAKRIPSSVLSHLCRTAHECLQQDADSRPRMRDVVEGMEQVFNSVKQEVEAA